MADNYAKTIAVILVSGAFCIGFVIGLISWSVYFEIKDSIHAEHRENLMRTYEVKE